MCTYIIHANTQTSNDRYIKTVQLFNTNTHTHTSVAILAQAILAQVQPFCSSSTDLVFGGWGGAGTRPLSSPPTCPPLCPHHLLHSMAPCTHYQQYMHYQDFTRFQDFTNYTLFKQCVEFQNYSLYKQYLNYHKNMDDHARSHYERYQESRGARGRGRHWPAGARPPHSPREQ